MIDIPGFLSNYNQLFLFALMNEYSNYNLEMIYTHCEN